MPIVQPPSGSPCWFEFSSSDPARSLDFHSKLFGWTSRSEDMGQMGAYHFLSHQNGSVGALCGLPPGAQGQPSNWGIYFAVANLDDSLAKAESLGGKRLGDPFDVPGHGRGAVLADPSGAVFSLWQSAHADAGTFTMFENHTVGWVELATHDVDAAKNFYKALFGWNYKSTPIPVEGAGDYTEIEIASTRYGGMMQMTKEWGDMPSHWSVYFPVASVDSSLERVKELGGNVCVAAFDAPGVGRIARYDDPTGGGAYLIQLAR